MRRHVEIEERFLLHDPWLRPPEHISTRREVDFSHELHKRTLGEPLVCNTMSTLRLIESLAISFDRQLLGTSPTRISGTGQHLLHVNRSQGTAGIRLQRHEAWRQGRDDASLDPTTDPDIDSKPDSKPDPDIYTYVLHPPPPIYVSLHHPFPTHVTPLHPSPDIQPSNEASGTNHAA